MLPCALETMSLCEIGPQLKLPSAGGKGSNIISTLAHLAWTKSRKSFCTTPGVGGGVGISKMF